MPELANGGRTVRTRSRKDELADLRQRLRAGGWSVDRIAERMRVDYRVNVRVAYRLACGLTQQQVADRWNERWPGTDAPKTSKQISYWESWPAPSGRPPSLETLDRLAAIYGCQPGDLLDRTNHDAEPSGRSSDVGATTTVTTQQSVGSVQISRATGEVTPVGRIPTTNVTEATLMYLESAAVAAVADSEKVAPRDLHQQVAALHNHVDYLLHGTQHPPQRARLYAVAVYVSGLLGTLALDSGRWAPAIDYAQKAYDLASYAEDPDLQSWARATQSLIAYYAGDYHGALDLARDGQRHARGGIHSVRLAINGEARALARLNDAIGVDEAVDRAFNLLTVHPAVQGVSPSLTLSVYCHARSAANAATAYLVLGRPRQVDEFVQVAIDAFDRAGLRGPQALSRLDLATALLMPGGDLDRACAVAAEAMAVISTDVFESVALRSAEFVGAAQPWGRSPLVRDVRELLSSYRSTGPISALALPSADGDRRAGKPQSTLE
jgi:tetratricopeptide (TPR) repeat protein/transcriptional regulator with XRE-family HTH domain